jgi:lipooligosaccharide transport system permease protein
MLGLGYGLGTLLPQVDGTPYITFLAAGTVCYSTMNSATFEALYSAFSRMHVQKTWESIMNAPIALDDIVFAEMLWAAIKALFSCAAILVVIFVLGISRAPSMLLALPVLGLAGVTFASLALVFNALAKGYDFFTYYFTLVITPMTFLSGVYFPIAQMPPWLQGVAQVLPLKAAVDLVRPLVLGNIPADPVQPLLILAGYACSGYYLALVLTRRRFFR